MLAALLQAPLALAAGLITPSDVGGFAAWQSLCLDGRLTPVRDHYAVLAQTTITRAHRARTLRTLVQTRTVVGRQSALWVHTGEAISTQIYLLYEPDQHRPKPQPGVQTHQTRLTPQDITEIDGLHVTSAARTAVDLAIHIDRPYALNGLRALATQRLVTLEGVLHRLEEIPGRSRRSDSVDLVQRAIS